MSIISDWLNDPKFEVEQLLERRRYDEGAKMCAALGQHDWYVDSNDFWLVCTYCSRCGISKPDSLGMNEFAKYIGGLPEDERDAAIKERSGPWKVEILGRL